MSDTGIGWNSAGRRSILPYRVSPCAGNRHMRRYRHEHMHVAPIDSSGANRHLHPPYMVLTVHTRMAPCNLSPA